MGVKPGQQRSWSLLTSVCAAVMLAAGCAYPAPHGDRELRREIEGVAPAHLREQNNPTRDPRVVNALWGDALLRRATPLAVRPRRHGGPAAAPSPVQPLLVTAARPPQVGLDGSPPTIAPADPGFARSVTGRLFFTMRSQPRSCTAMVVASDSRAVIATAGHCLYSTADAGSRVWAANVMFIPGYADGAGSVGRWFTDTAPGAVAVTTGWQQRQDWAEDIGFVRLGRRGPAIQDVTGGLGVAFGGSGPPTRAGVGVDVLGYPAAVPYDGARLQECSSRAVAAPATPDDRAASSDPVDPGSLSAVCSMTAGYSGGPWLSRGQPATVVAVSSHDFGAGAVYGARPGAAALAAFRRVDIRS